MSNKSQVIEFTWPEVSPPWPSFQSYIETQIRRKDLEPYTGIPVQVVATFSMSQSDERWHTDVPCIDSLVTKLVFCLHESGIIDDLCISQINVGKVIPGPNAIKTRPGVRVSILALPSG